MERKSEITKALLGEKFKKLMKEKSFDKITIKMITDEAGVIRPTFYNYFQDKYEVMEWLLREDVFDSVEELIHMDMELEALKVLFRKIERDKEYYVKAFQVEGQNSFEEMMFDRIFEMVRSIIEKHRLKLKDETQIINKDIFMKFQALTLVNGIKFWLIYEGDEISSDQALKFYEFLMSHSLPDLLEDHISDKVID
ncbi:TetR family transcriptional regulator [[Clostridium] hylemonae]|uniref:TetR family transcriptional regulator n=1 Tax=[Clostridium] hylemonae TaxID=89153 RepID=UPI003992297F